MAEKVSVITESPRSRVTGMPPRAPEPPSAAESAHPRYAFRALHEIVHQLRDAPNRVLLLDLDGTLVRLRRRPEDVRVSMKAKAILKRLSRLPNTTVAILSGRSIRSLEKLIDLKSLHYFGLHGGEQTHKGAKINAEQRTALRSARRSARTAMAEFSGVNIEDKKYGFTVHYRGADKAAIRGANQALLAIMAPLRHALHVLDGKKVWEVLPRQIPGKGSTMKRVMADSPQSALAYIGDDEPDEPAFAALESHVTIHVGDNKNTHARFYLRNPGEVLRFLDTLEKELR
jgi:trehalose-phosphatase